MLNHIKETDAEGFMFIVTFDAVVGFIALSWLTASLLFMSWTELYLFALIVLASTIYALPA